MKKTAAFIAILILVALGNAQPLSATDQCDVMYRLWQDGENTFYHYREIINIDEGKTYHLYIHFKSRTKNRPYTTSADIDIPSRLGIINDTGYTAENVKQNLKLGKKDQAKGKREFRVIGGDRTGLGYRIWGVKSPGRLDHIPPECRMGLVHFIVY